MTTTASTADVWGTAPAGPVTDVEPRCWQCSRILAWVVSQPWVIDCSRCKARNSRGTGDRTAADFGAALSTRRRRARA